jgi:hypothetical protein
VNQRQSRNLWNQSAFTVSAPKRQARREHKNNRAYDHTFLLPDFLTCCYKNLFSIFLQFKSKQKSNLASILWFSKLIVQNTHSLRSKCKVRKWKHVIWYFSHTPSGNQFSVSHVTSSDQGHSSSRGKSLGTRLYRIHRENYTISEYFLVWCVAKFKENCKPWMIVSMPGLFVNWGVAPYLFD